MYIDDKLKFSSAQAITTTAVSTNTVDLGVARDMGKGRDLTVVFTVGTPFAGGTSVKFEVITADNEALSSNVKVVGSSDAVLTAALIAGFQENVTINPQTGSTGKRYLGARYTVVGTYTGGTVSADIPVDVQDKGTAYASGISII